MIGSHPKTFHNCLLLNHFAVTSSSFFCLLMAFSMSLYRRVNIVQLGLRRKILVTLIAWLSLADKNIPSRYWDVVAEHGVLLNAVTFPAMDETTKTIFETTFNHPPDYDGIPQLGVTL